MKSTILLAAALATSSGQPKVSFTCSAFARLPDGAWMVHRTKPISIDDVERRTLNVFVVHAGTRLSTDAEATLPSRGDPLSALVATMRNGVDLVDALNKRCR